ncbi:head-tail connector protein [Velocimicrobium porci]|uniref:Uncharacterized protein n=1 Tax=Velocimicrobium porci TaxID=2606634 RepID=A0A6L5Y177_9FIRM|nr:hypothetical protein [Velocimicrobium porci]MSS64597.1 hypothetical protein [Velocimicrobium porci]
MPYAEKEYYIGVFQGHIPEEEISKYLNQASRHIDSLTYNRIVGRGISNLTEFQKDILKEVCCEQAEFEYNNREIFDMILQGYSINGVSMQFGESWNVSIQKGIPMKRDTYEILSQTGLTCRLAV